MSAPADKPLPWSVVALTTIVLTAVLVGSAMVWSALHPEPPEPPKPCAETFGQNCGPGQTIEIVDMGDRKSIVCRCPKEGAK